MPGIIGRNEAVTSCHILTHPGTKAALSLTLSYWTTSLTLTLCLSLSVPLTVSVSHLLHLQLHLHLSSFSVARPEVDLTFSALLGFLPIPLPRPSLPAPFSPTHAAWLRLFFCSFFSFFDYFVDCILESFIQWRAHNTPALQVSRESGVQVIANWLIRLTAPPLGPHLANIGNCDPPLSCLQFSACGFRCSLFVIRCCNSFSSFFLFLSLPLCRFTVQCNATGSCKVAVCPPQRTG